MKLPFCVRTCAHPSSNSVSKQWLLSLLQPNMKAVSFRTNGFIIQHATEKVVSKTRPSTIRVQSWNTISISNYTDGSVGIPNSNNNSIDYNLSHNRLHQFVIFPKNHPHKPWDKFLQLMSEWLLSLLFMLTLDSCLTRYAVHDTHLHSL